jgi:PTS system N-acetylgalactosamine-specific IIA component
MKYVLPVSHGTVAPSMHETLKAFFLGDKADLIHANMKEGMGPDKSIEEVRETLRVIKPEDELIVLAALLGGSPPSPMRPM